MDEPTASLAKHETEALFQLVERLKARGISIVYISHRMDEVYRIADRITILRDGQQLFTKRLSEVTPAQIVEGIVGRKIEGELEYQERDRPLSKTALLEARHLQAGTRVNDVSFHPARRRDPRPGRADGQRPHRACQGAVRHRFDQLRRSARPRAAGQSEQPSRRQRPRHRPGAGGPPAAGPHPGPLRPGELVAAPAREAAARPVRLRPGRQGAGQGSAGTDFRSRWRTPVDPFGCFPAATSRRSSSPSGSAPTRTC